MAMPESVVCYLLVNRSVRTRMSGGVGAGGVPPRATRLGIVCKILFLELLDR